MKVFPFPFVHPTIADILACQSAPSFCNNQTNDKPPQHDVLQKQRWDQFNAKMEDSSSMDSPSPQNLPPQQKEALIELAMECDDFVFHQDGLVDFLATSNSSSGIQTMVEWGKSNPVTHLDDTSDNDDSNETAKGLLAALLALNRLEAAIRHATKHSTAGRAPLLKVMIQKLSDGEQNQQQQQSGTSKKINVSPLLKILLLPNPGLNLRNLLWHGFVAALPRPWLAVVLASIVILERDYPCNVASNNNTTLPIPISPLGNHTEFGPILQRGEELLNGDIQTLDTSWISDGSYKQWWNLVQDWVLDHTREREHGYPLCICILLTCLLEHTLRQYWCHDNQRMEDSQARPAAFYVTLDGHGQRRQHDVLLHPYVGDEQRVKNTLIDRLGGPTMSLLADLYCSPCGGPNLRASLAHGLWDDYLQQELQSTTSLVGKTDNNDQAVVFPKDDLWDLVRVLLVLVEAIGKVPNQGKAASLWPVMLYYRPLFSYTAATCRKLDLATHELQELYILHDASQYKDRFQTAETSVNLNLGSIGDLKISVDRLEQLAKPIYGLCGRRDNSSSVAAPWSKDDIFWEHETNQKLASLGAARALLDEIADACSAFRFTINEILDDENTTNASSRQRRQRQRVLAATDLAICIYSFAALTAIALLEHDSTSPDSSSSSQNSNGNLDRETLLQAVKRSRMVLSTVSNFITVNTDRATKAAKEYRQGKATKALLTRHQPSKNNDIT